MSLSFLTAHFFADFSVGIENQMVSIRAVQVAMVILSCQCRHGPLHANPQQA